MKDQVYSVHSWERISIPHHHLIHKEILQPADVAEGRVHENMNKIPSMISFMLPGDPYLSLMVHCIDVPVDSQSTWKLKTSPDCSTD